MKKCKLRVFIVVLFFVLCNLVAQGEVINYFIFGQYQKIVITEQLRNSIYKQFGIAIPKCKKSFLKKQFSLLTKEEQEFVSKICLANGEYSQHFSRFIRQIGTDQSPVLLGLNMRLVDVKKQIDLFNKVFKDLEKEKKRTYSDQKNYFIAALLMGYFLDRFDIYDKQRDRKLEMLSEDDKKLYDVMSNAIENLKSSKCEFVKNDGLYLSALLGVLKNDKKRVYKEFNAYNKSFQMGHLFKGIQRLKDIVDLKNIPFSMNKLQEQTYSNFILDIDLDYITKKDARESKQQQKINKSIKKKKIKPVSVNKNFYPKLKRMYLEFCETRSDNKWKLKYFSFTDAVKKDHKYSTINVKTGRIKNYSIVLRVGWIGGKTPSYSPIPNLPPHKYFRIVPNFLLRCVSTDDGDGFILEKKYKEINSCSGYEHRCMKIAPKDGYQKEIKFTQKEIKSIRCTEQFHLFFRLNGKYGKMSIYIPRVTRSRLSASTSSIMYINYTGSRNLKTKEEDE
jgi:hypothetical protein